MNIFLNPASTPPAVQLKANGSPLASMRLKRGAVVPLMVTILGVQNATNLRFGIKSAHEGEMLALASANSGTAADNGTTFTLSLEVRSNALDAALHVGDAASSLSKLVGMAEFAWMEGDEQRLSDTIATTILNDIVRLASESPEALSALYPAPDTLATKAWVRELRASSSAAGLVLLESDAVLEGEHTAVALTAAGAIALPRATGREAGTVQLGTDATLSGLHVLPVGKDQAGKLAVDASGLSAYDIAVKNGFVGTAEDWLASLKGEPGEDGMSASIDELEALLSSGTEDVSTPAGTEARWWRWCQIAALHVPAHQELLAVILKAGDDVSDAYIGEFRLSVWEADEQGEFHALALSTNTCHHVAGQEMVFEFAPGVYFAGRSLRFCSGSADATTNAWDTSRIIRTQAAASSEGDFLQQSSRLLWLPEIVFRMRAQRFAEATHVKDTVAHLTAAEHNGLLELLAHKDAILAAFPASSTQDETGEVPQ